MEKRKIAPKRIWINILIVFALLLITLVTIYVVYIVKTESPEKVPESELTGREYSSVSGDVQLTLLDGNGAILRENGQKIVFENREYTDGIIAFSTEETTETGPIRVSYTFVILSKDRLFYNTKGEGEILYLVWYGV